MIRVPFAAAGLHRLPATLALVTLTTLVACAAGRSPEAVPADPAAAYKQAREQAAVALADLKSYDIAGAIHLENVPTGGGEPMVAELAFDVAARWPDRLLVTQSTAGTEPVEPILNLGTGPDASWFHYQPMQAAYRGAPVKLVRDLDAAATMELDDQHVFNFYYGLGQLLLPSDRVPTEPAVADTLTVDGREVICRVFSLPGLAPDPQGRGATPGPGRWWLDPATGVCLKVVTSSSINGRGGAVTQNVTFTVTRFSTSVAPSDARFTWTAPEGVRLAPSLEHLANPETMVGQPAPDAELTGLDGKAFKLSDLRGQVVFLDLWATWCGPCRMEMPHLEKLHQEIGKSVAFVAASSEDQPVIEAFLQKTPYTMRIVRISEADAAGKFKARSIPTGFVIDKEGVIRAHLVGAQNEEQLRRALARAGVGK